MPTLQYFPVISKPLAQSVAPRLPGVLDEQPRGGARRILLCSDQPHVSFRKNMVPSLQGVPGCNTSGGQGSPEINERIQWWRRAMWAKAPFPQSVVEEGCCRKGGGMWREADTSTHFSSLKSCAHIFPGSILKETCYLQVLEDVVCACEAGGISHIQPDMWNAENPHNILMSSSAIMFWENVMVNFMSTW